MHRVCALVCGVLCLGWCLGVAAPAWSGAAETAVYGVLRQSPQGGIELVPPEEPHVVYIPFDPGSIMSDWIGLQVQMRGVVRDSFSRDGTTYRVLAVSQVRPLTAEYGNTTVTDHAAYGLPGTDPVQIHAYFNKACYLYARYAVLERQSSDADGHSLRVLERQPQDDPAAVCEHLQGTPLFKIPNGGDYTFVGLSGDVLFVRNGSASDMHGLMAANLAQQRQILNATVVPGAHVDGHTLHYRQVLSTGSGPRCPSGKTAVQGMVLDLTSGMTRHEGKTTCWP